MLKRVKSIKEIYGEVKDFNLVITNDAALARGLNRLVDKPRLGALAMTPKQIANKYSNVMFGGLFEKYEIVLALCKKFKKPVNYVHVLVEKIFDIWNHCGKYESIEHFLAGDDLPYYEEIKNYPTLETALDRFDESYYGDMKIAVAGLELFTLLDREILPKKGIAPVEINIFKEEELEIPRTCLFDTTKDSIDTIIPLIEKKYENDIAIVINPESEYYSVIESRLKTTGIKVQTKNFLSGETNTAFVLSLMETALRFDDLTLKDFTELTGFLGIKPDYKYFPHNLKSAEHRLDGIVKKFYDFLRGATGIPLSELLLTLKNDFSVNVHNSFSDVIKSLDYEKEKLSEESLLNIKYFIKYFDSELDSENRGVIFVNVMNSAFIDRETIIYAGLDSTWTKPASDKEYISKQEENLRNISKFQVLLGQGSKRFYFANRIYSKEKVTPCYYFNLLWDRNISGFDYEKFNSVKYSSGKDYEIEKNPEITSPKREDIKLADTEKTSSISATSLKSYVLCPKNYFFTRVLPGEDNMYFMRGTLLHSFAEFYFHHPDFVRKKLEEIIILMTQKMTAGYTFLNPASEKTIMKIGSNRLIEFIDKLTITRKTYAKPEKAKDNILMSEYNKPKVYTNTERCINSDTLNIIKGKMDLSDDSMIIDYKSSSTRKASNKLLLNSLIDHILKNENYDFDFQALCYLSPYVSDDNSKEYKFIFDYLLANLYNSIGATEKPEMNSSTLVYIPEYFNDYILSEKFYNELKQDIPVIFDKVTYELYRETMSAPDITSEIAFDKKILAEKIEQPFADLLLIKQGYKLNDFKKKKEETLKKDIISKITKEIFSLRTGTTDIANYFKEDIEKFIEFIKEKLTKINKYNESVFPCEPVFESRDVCKKCDNLSLCGGNKLWN